MLDLRVRTSYNVTTWIENGAAGGTRTHNLLITNQGLDQLSYGGAGWHEALHMPKITHKLVPGKQSFRVTFRHPLEGNAPKSYGLGADEIVATMICKDVEALLGDQELLQDPEKHRVRLATAYEVRAVEIVFGQRATNLLADSPKPGVLDPEEEENLRGKVLTKVLYDEKSINRSLTYENSRGQKETLISPDAKGDLDYALEELQGITPKAVRRLQEDLSKALKRIQELDSQNKAMRAELIELRKKANVSVTATIAEAIRGPATSGGRRRKDWNNESPLAFEQFYKTGHEESQFRRVGTGLWKFVAQLRHKGETMVGAVTASDIDSWLTTVRKADGSEMHPRTRRVLRTTLSVFFRWASKRYAMGTNPMRDADPIRGTAIEDIKAIRKLGEIKALLVALEPWPYWQAWAAFAILAGPRFSEQSRLKVTDVFIGEGYVRLTARKTGRQRNVSIEKSILAPILKKHLQRRQKEGTGSGLVFPTLTGPGIIERKKSAPDTWSHNRCWHYYWKDLVTKITGVAEADLESAIKEGRVAAFWSYGPREWRHTFGTVLGMCGWGALEISRAMGNSPVVADRHYVAVASKGAKSRWPMRW